MAEPLLVATVQMPERGVFTVRVDDALAVAGVPSDAKGRFIVALDYGEDVGDVVGVETYDPSVHGPRIPGFRLVRPFEAADERTLAENSRRAEEMRKAFLEVARETLPDLRVPCARLSFGRRRLFLRYVCDRPHPNFSAAQEALRIQFKVDANLWAMGPRDEVAELGGIGPCGRVCCCCSWQHRYPSHLSPDRRSSQPSLMNGTCGRFKCCLAFERE